MSVNKQWWSSDPPSASVRSDVRMQRSTPRSVRGAGGPARSPSLRLPRGSAGHGARPAQGRPTRRTRLCPRCLPRGRAPPRSRCWVRSAAGRAREAAWRHSASLGVATPFQSPVGTLSPHRPCPPYCGTAVGSLASVSSCSHSALGGGKSDWPPSPRPHPLQHGRLVVARDPTRCNQALIAAVPPHIFHYLFPAANCKFPSRRARRATDASSGTQLRDGATRKPPRRDAARPAGPITSRKNFSRSSFEERAENKWAAGRDRTTAAAGAAHAAGSAASRGLISHLANTAR